MKFINLTYDYVRLTKGEIKEELEKLVPEIDRVKNAISDGYESDYAALSLPADKAYLNSIEAVVDGKKALKPKALFIIGIGGSNLGTMALQQAVQGLFVNEKEDIVHVYYVDTIDTAYTQDLLNSAKEYLNQGDTILINVISKSGSTTETIVNFELFFNLLIHYYPQNYHDYIVVTTDKNSSLYAFAEKQQITTLPVPKKVGGRYSVFSAVGLFPLGLMGFNLEEILEGAYAAIVDGLSDDTFDNVAALSAALIYTQYKNHNPIHDLFLFSPELESLGKWYRQLMGESIGKEEDRQGNKVNVGMTPTVSIGTTDLHSVGQLYLGGPYDKFTTLIHIDEVDKQIELPRFSQFDELVKNIQGKTIKEIKNAIFGGVQAAYVKNSRPFMTITLPKKNAYYIAQLMQMQMMQMMYLGYFLNVNPFNQPQVEYYKEETRNLLKS